MQRGDARKQSDTIVKLGKAYDRKQYRYFLKSWMIGAFAVVALSAFFKQAISTLNIAVTTRFLDPVIAEFGIAAGGAVLGTVLVGLLLDDYQQRFTQHAEDFSELIKDEGILDVFRDANDPKLLSTLQSSIDQAHDEIIAFGLGLGILHNNRNLLGAMAARLNETKNLTVAIYTGAATNSGVNNRIKEETNWHNRKGMNYDPNWVDKYPKEISTVLHALTKPDHHVRLTTKNVDVCAMFGCIKIDDRLFMFPYGSPDVRGSESPWLSLKIDNRNKGYLVQFALRSIAFFQNADNYES
jgi:hypothetical protein